MLFKLHLDKTSCLSSVLTQYSNSIPASNASSGSSLEDWKIFGFEMDTYELWVNLLGVIQLPILCEGIPSRYLQMHPTCLTLELRRCNRETAGLKLGFGYKTSSIWTGYEQIWTNGPIFLLFLKNLHFHTLNLHLYIVYVIFSYYEHSLNIYIYMYFVTVTLCLLKKEKQIQRSLRFCPPEKKQDILFILYHQLTPRRFPPRCTWVCPCCEVFHSSNQRCGWIVVCRWWQLED